MLRKPSFCLTLNVPDILLLCGKLLETLMQVTNTCQDTLRIITIQHHLHVGLCKEHFLLWQRHWTLAVLCQHDPIYTHDDLFLIE